MAYRYDESKQRIVYEPEGGPGDDGGHELEGADLPDLPGGMAPGFAPEPDPYDGFGPRRNPGGYAPVSRPKIFDPDTGQFFYTDEVPVKDQFGDMTGTKTTYTPATMPKAPGPSLADQLREKEQALGRPMSDYERNREVFGWAPPTGASGGTGRDLRMSDSEAGNLAARREELAYQRESGQEKLGFEREKEAFDQEYQSAQIELSRATMDFNKAKEEANQKQHEIANEIARAKLAQDDRAQAALEAYRDQQLALDRQKIDQAERQMAESARQFAVVDARMRRQQALAEAEAGQRAAGDYIKAFGYSPAYAGNAPGFGRITPEDVTRMTQPAYRG